MGGSFCQQFKALVKRNLLIKRRRIPTTCAEILLPLVTAALIAFIRSFIPMISYPAIPDFPSHTLFQNSFLPDPGKSLMVTPNTSDVKLVMDQAVADLPITATPKYRMFDNEDAMVKAYRAKSSAYSLGVMFSPNPVSNGTYQIRVPDNAQVPPEVVVLPESVLSCRSSLDGLSRTNCLANTGYLFSGFATLQVAIENALIKVKTSSSIFQIPKISVKMMPKEKFSEKPIAAQLLVGGMTGVFLLLGFVMPSVSQLVTEKEKFIRDYLNMTGLNRIAFWLSWTVIYAVLGFVVALGTTAIFRAGSIFVYSNFGLVFLIALLSIYASYVLILWMSTWFVKVKMSQSLTIIFIILAILFYVVKIPTFTGKETPVFAFWICSLFPPLAFCFALDQLIIMEWKFPFEGLQSHNLGYTTYQQNFPISYAILMLFLDIIVYYLLLGYFDNVVPGVFGKRKSMLFFLKKSYWKPKCGKPKNFSHLRQGQDIVEDIEDVPSDLKGKESIRIFNVQKYYQTEKKTKRKACSSNMETVKAVDGVSLDIYEGMITALLGHNGAGKSTLFGIMSGLINPSHGTTTIYGKNVCDDGELYHIYRMLGVCPQQDVLYDDLSVVQHLELYANIRGVEDVYTEIQRVVDLVDLSSQMHTHASELSGGQKRKLSVGLALIGDPQVIFLDEPTAGMDPYSRRKIWSLLKSIKKNRTILLTTHFMDEADILADRKAIMNKGKLQCYGSSMFLKNKFGIGYRLNLVTTEDCNANEVTDFIKERIPDARLTRQHGMELAYTLPMSDTDKFSDLFHSLETIDKGDDNGNDLGVKNYGISMPTLEEVFLRLAEHMEVQEFNEDVEDIKLKEILVSDKAKLADSRQNLIKTEERANGEARVQIQEPLSYIERSGDPRVNQFKAIVWMRARILNQLKIVLVFRLVFPILLCVGGIVMLVLMPNQYSYKEPKTNNFQTVWQTYFTNYSELLYLNSTASSLDKLVNNFNYTGHVTSSPMNASTNFSVIKPHHGAFSFSNVDLTSFTSKPEFLMYYNDSAVHSIPILLNMWSNAWYRAYSNDTTWSMNITSRRLPTISPSVVFSDRLFNGIRIFGTGLALFCGWFGFEVLEDRQAKCRSQLKVAGVTVRMYWLSTIAAHMLQCAIPSLVLTIVLLASGIPEFSYPSAVVQVLILAILYIPINLLHCYCQSFAFKNPESCSSVQINLITMIAVLPYFAVTMLDSVNFAVSLALHYIFCVIFPPYLIIGGMHFIARIHSVALLKNKVSELSEVDFWRFENHVMGTILLSVAHLFVWYLLLVVLDVRSTGGKISEAFCASKPKKLNVRHYDGPFEIDDDDVTEMEDSDVIEERRLVEEMCSGKGSQENTVILVHELRKEFSKRTGNTFNCCKPSVDTVKVAVDDLSFHVESGQVFGLLGHNGAGKTTALNIIMADLGADRGKVMVGGHNVDSSMSEAFKELGCCPQKDQLWAFLTLEDTMKGYAMIHGVSKQQMNDVIDYYLENLQIGEHRKKLVKDLSGGTKRKLSYAISMIGFPKAVLLDEPSTGMDPASKRFLWDTVIKGFSGTNRGAILTTHSMEEADALCTRVGIMVAGSLKCLGPTQHLKTTFGGGYTLEVKLRHILSEDPEEQLARLKDYIKGIFPNVEIMEQFGDRVQYKVPQESVKALSLVFSSVEQAKDRLGIEEYSFSQSTLEQVFIRFAKQEYEAVESVKRITK